MESRLVSVLLAFCAILMGQLCEGVTLEDFQKTLNIVHDVCVAKAKVTKEQIQQLKAGDFLSDTTVKCYTKCYMEMLHLQTDGKGSFATAYRHSEFMIPDELLDTTVKAFEHCETAGDHLEDHCEAAYELLKCITTDNPNFWFNSGL